LLRSIFFILPWFVIFFIYLCRKTRIGFSVSGFSGFGLPISAFPVSGFSGFGEASTEQNVFGRALR
jgi:hypothetical protein